MRRLAAVAALLALAVSMPLLAQARRLDAVAGKAWKHKPTGIEFPAAAGGVPRAGVVDYGAHEWDIVGQYETAGRQTIVSLYVFESQVPDAAIAFESARRALEVAPPPVPVNFLANATPLAPPATYAPAGQSARSGLKIVYSSTGNYKASALAVAPWGGTWLVKIRISSQVLTPAETAQLLDRVIAEFALPSDKVKQPVPANPVAACEKPMPALPRSAAMKVAKGQPLMNIVLGPAGSNVGRLYDQGSAKPRFCKDAAVANGRAVYRQIDGEEGFFIPVNDNGSAIHARRDVLADILAWQPGKDLKGAAPPTYNVYMTTPGATLVFYPQDSLPPPQQAYDLVTEGKWVVKNERTQKGDAIDIDPDYIP